MLQSYQIVGLTLRNGEPPFVDVLLRHHLLGHRLGACHHKDRLGCRQRGYHLGAQYLIGGIALPVFCRTPVARREEQHPSRPHHLRQVVIEIARLVGIVEYEDHSPLVAADLHELGHTTEKQRCRRACEPLKLHGLPAVIAEQAQQSLGLRQFAVSDLQFPDVHSVISLSFNKIEPTSINSLRIELLPKKDL